MTSEFETASEEIIKALSLPKDSGEHKDIYYTFIIKIQDMTHKLDDKDLSDDGLAARAKEITDLAASYYEYNRSRIEFICESATRGSTAAEHEDAARLKTKGRGMRGGLQSVVNDYLICNLEIQRSIRLVEKSIAYAESQGRTVKENSNFSYDYDLPPKVALMLSRNTVLLDYMKRLKGIEPRVTKLEVAFYGLENVLTRLIRKRKAKAIVKNFSGQIRKQCFDDALMILQEAEVKNTKKFSFDKKKNKEKWAVVYEIVDIIKDYVEKNADELEGRGKRLFLRQWEVDLAYSLISKEQKSAALFLDEHELPEMKYRLDALKREKERLRNLGDFENLLGALEELQKGYNIPMLGLKNVRTFESGILKQVEHFAYDVSRSINQTYDKAKELGINPDPNSVPAEMLFEGIDENFDAEEDAR